MSEETENTQVMSWEDAARLKEAEQAALKAGLSQGNKFMSFKGGVLSIDKMPCPNNELEVIALTFCAENAWYKGKFDPTTTQSPMCWSVYTNTGDMVPNAKSQDMQSELCHDCPKYQWGSDPQGGRGKACKTRTRLAMLPGNVNDAGEVHGAELRFATLPVTSGGDFDKFVADCKMTLNRPIFGVVAKIKVTPDAKSQYKVSLTPVRAIPGDMMTAILARVDDAEKAIMYEYANMDADSSAEAPKPLK